MLPNTKDEPLGLLSQRLQRTLPDARLTLRRFADCPGLRLGLINADYQTGPLDPAVMQAVIAKPAYWAFCWGSGLALARWIARNPKSVAGKSVLDVGSGSGVAGIAAALAGASQVVACDVDDDALAATRTNAELSGVDVTLCKDLATAPNSDVALLADVLYDRSNLPLLAAARKRAATVYVADSRVSELPNPDYRLIAEDTALTEPNLGEFDEFADVRIWLSPA